MRTLLTAICFMLALSVSAQDYKDSSNYGKKIAVFGGSFSEIPASGVAKAYWAEVLRAEVTTYGIGGAGFSIQTGEDRWLPGQVDRALSSGKKYDVYILWASTNDVSHGVSLEEQNAQIKVCVEKIRQGAPDAKVLFFSSLPVPLLEHAKEPTPEEEAQVPENYRETYKNMLINMKKIPQYVEAQQKVCQELGIPFLNLYTTSGINEYNAPDFFSHDRLHLNTAGYNHIKETQARFIAAH